MDKTLMRWLRMELAALLVLSFIVIFVIPSRADMVYTINLDETAGYVWNSESEQSFNDGVNSFTMYGYNQYPITLDSLGLNLTYKTANPTVILNLSSVIDDNVNVTSIRAYYYVNSANGKVFIPSGNGAASETIIGSSEGWNTVSISPFLYSNRKAYYTRGTSFYGVIKFRQDVSGKSIISQIEVTTDEDSSLTFYPNNDTTEDSNLSLDYSVESGYPDANIKLTYIYQDSNGSFTGSSYTLTHEGTYSGSGRLALQNYIWNLNNFSGRTVQINAVLYGDWDSYYVPSIPLANDSIIFNQSDNITVPDIPSPTPIITPVYTPFPTPTPVTFPNYTPPSVSENTTINNTWAGDYFAYVDSQMSGWNSTISNISSFGTFPISTFRGYVDDVNDSLNSVNYSKSVLVLGLIVPVMVDSLHWKVKALVTFYLVCVLILIVLGRE